MLDAKPLTHPDSQATRSRQSLLLQPLQILVGLYNQCLGEALCSYLRGEDAGLEILNQTDAHRSFQPQIFLTDLPSLQAGAHLACPDAKVIVIDEGLDLLQQQAVFLYPGVCGLIQPDCSDELLLKAIRCVAAGELWIDGETVKSLLCNQAPRLQSTPVHLTRKERQIVDLVLQGLKNKAIAAEVFLSESTVKVYLSRVFRKYGVKNRCELIARLTQASPLN